MNEYPGKFIVLYGINNIGKSTQAKILLEKLKKDGHKCKYVKYAIYDLEPAGKLINDYLRDGNPYDFTPRELQLLHYIDRISFEPKLKEKLKNGTHIVSECYFGTGMAWGMAGGVSEKLLKYLYSFLFKEDLAILLEGKRFEKAIEAKHKHEKDSALIKKAEANFSRLADEYNWTRVNGNQKIEKVAQEIHTEISKII